MTAPVERLFVVALTVRPGTRLPAGGEVELNFPEQDRPMSIVTMRNLLETTPSGDIVPMGLQLDVKVAANDVDGAVLKAKGIADGVVSFVTLVTGVGLPVVKEQLAYDISPSISERDFLQLFHDIPLQPSRRQLDPAIMIDIMDRVFKIVNEDERDRVLRAIRWYRRGALATDPLEQFTWYWIGLECLNPLLQEKLRVPDDKTRCPECDHEWVSTPTVSGIREIMLRLGYAPDIYRRMKDLRIGLIHGKSDLKVLVPEAAAVIPKAREVLVRSLFQIIETAPSEGLLRDTVSVEVPIIAAVEAKILSEDTSNLGPTPSEHPHFEVKSHTVERAELSKDKISARITTQLVTRVAQGVTVRSHGWRVYAPEATIDKVEAK